MNIVIHAPYGMAHEESGVLYLLGNYVRTFGHQNSQLRCNGIFSLCDRDAENDFQPDLTKCMRCMKENSSLAQWSEHALIDLSHYLKPEEVGHSKRWILSLTSDQLLGAHLKGVRLSELVEETFRKRSGIELSQITHKRHEETLRRLMLAAFRMSAASKRFLQKENPDLCLIANGDDFLTRSFFAQCRAERKAAVLFRWDKMKKSTLIFHPADGRVLSSELMFPDVLSLRSDARTWPRELTMRLDAIMEFLELGGGQLPLPLAR